MSWTPPLPLGNLLRPFAVAVLAWCLIPLSAPAQHSGSHPGLENGWSFFNDTLRERLALSEDQLTRLLVVDEDYRQRYVALGTQPWVHAGYGPLTDAREREVRGILSSQQYKAWMDTFGGDRSPGAPPTAVPVPEP